MGRTKLLVERREKSIYADEREDKKNSSAPAIEKGDQKDGKKILIQCPTG